MSKVRPARDRHLHSLGGSIKVRTRARDLVTGKVGRGGVWRPNKWGAGLEVEAGVGPQPLLFLVFHLCHYGGLKLSTVLPQRLSESPANKPL